MPLTPRPILPALAAFDVCEEVALVELVPLPVTEELPDVTELSTDERLLMAEDSEDSEDALLDGAEMGIVVKEVIDDSDGSDDTEGMDTDGRDAVGTVVVESDTGGRETVTEDGTLKLVPVCQGMVSPALLIRTWAGTAGREEGTGTHGCWYHLARRQLGRRALRAIERRYALCRQSFQCAVLGFWGKSQRRAIVLTGDSALCTCVDIGRRAPVFLVREGVMRNLPGPTVQRASFEQCLRGGVHARECGVISHVLSSFLLLTVSVDCCGCRAKHQIWVDVEDLRHEVALACCGLPGLESLTCGRLCLIGLGDISTPMLGPPGDNCLVTGEALRPRLASAIKECYWHWQDARSCADERLSPYNTYPSCCSSWPWPRQVSMALALRGLYLSHASSTAVLIHSSALPRPYEVRSKRMVRRRVQAGFGVHLSSAGRSSDSLTRFFVLSESRHHSVQWAGRKGQRRAQWHHSLYFLHRN